MKKILLAAFLACWVGIARADIIINEFYRGGSFSATGDEYVEFLITTDYTAAQLESLHFGDSTSATVAKFADYSFDNLDSIALTFKAGTLIVVSGGLVLQNLTYNPVAGGGTDDDWSLVLNVGGTHIADNAGSTMDFAGTDVAWVGNTGVGDLNTLHSINWDSTPGDFGVAATVTIAAPANNSGVQFTGSTLAGITDSGNYGAGISMAVGNGGSNSEWIDDLRAIPEPLSVGLLTSGLCVLLALRRRMDNVPGL